MPYTIDFTGRNAVVTGGTRGIGRAISTRLAECGARVGMIYRADAGEAKNAVEQLGGGSFALQADLAHDSTARDVGAQCVARFDGAIDFVVLNAASVGGGPIDEMDDEAWRRVFDVTVHGHRALLAALAQAMPPAGAVVFISSGAGHDPLPGLGAYGASKSAVNHMARVLAQEWGPRGVRVNVVSPGGTAKAPVDYDNLTASERETVDNTALRRIGTADDVAKAVLFFLSDLSSFVTGQVVRCNGGRV